jgi:hypothetical protein
VALAEDWGLVVSGIGRGLVGRCRSGDQYLALQGRVEQPVLLFLPHVIDDLHARQALLCAGTVMVDEFRDAIIRGRGMEHARRCVPDAFAPAVTDALAIDLFAASVALIAVELISQAEWWLQQELDDLRLTADDMDHATGELSSLFDLFGDSDALAMFEMSEPSDAALARTTPQHQWLGMADQRVDKWFVPFAFTPPTGYLTDKWRSLCRSRINTAASRLTTGRSPSSRQLTGRPGLVGPAWSEQGSPFVYCVKPQLSAANQRRDNLSLATIGIRVLAP